MGKRLQRYEGESVDVLYDRQLCIHAAECGRAAGDLFVGGRKPWCDPAEVPADDAVAVVERCPTGALVYERKDGGAAEAPPPENTLQISPAGPVYLRGDLEIQAADGETTRHTRVGLCRCGASKNKPFCDNAHKKIEFTDPGPVASSVSGDISAPTGPVKVTVFKNGPVQVKGEIAIYAGSGRLAERTDEAYLCRCGKSANRPYCDGTHKRIGFTPDGD